MRDFVIFFCGFVAGGSLAQIINNIGGKGGND